MKVTRVIFEKTGQTKALAVCSVVIENSLKLKHIRLYRNQEGKYYLIFPSIQDVSQQIQRDNPNLVIKCIEREDSRKKWDEFYIPLKSDFYSYLLSTVLEGYKLYIEESRRVFLP